MSKTEKPFDAVALMRRLRDEIDRDVEHMTEEQRREYVHSRAERFWAQLAEKESRAGVDMDK
jgi:hypothetical protein